MFSTDSYFKILVCFPSFCDCDTHQRSDAFTIDADKRILGQKTVKNVAWQELPSIVARQTQAGLSEIISAKGKKLSLLSNLVGDQARPRKFDHCPDKITHFDAPGLHGFSRDTIHDLALHRQLLT